MKQYKKKEEKELKKTMNQIFDYLGNRIERHTEKKIKELRNKNEKQMSKL